MAHRRRVFKGAVLTFNGLGAFEGVVRNQSEKGAMLALRRYRRRAGVVRSRHLADEAKRPAHMRWRSLNAIGVEFV